MKIMKNMKTLIDGLMLLDLTESDVLAVCYMLDTEEKVIDMLLWFKSIIYKPSKKEVLNQARDICIGVQS